MQEFDVDNIVAYACWAPSYEVNETISILNYEIKIKKIIEDKIYGFKYEIELIGVKYKIKNMIVNEEELIAAGITPGYVRLSIGLEHADDIIADFEQALAKI